MDPADECQNTGPLRNGGGGGGRGRGGSPHLCPSCSAATQLHLHLNREALCGKGARPLELDWV